MKHTIFIAVFAVGVAGTASAGSEKDAQPPLPEITQLKEMYLRTALTAEGRAACAIVPPADDLEAAAKSQHPHAVRAADIDGDGRHEVFVAGADHAVHAIAPDGRRLWRHELPGTILDLNVSVGKDPSRRILSLDENVGLLSLQLPRQLVHLADNPFFKLRLEKPRERR